MLRRLIGFIILAQVLGTGVFAEDWPQWMGPRRDGTWNETGIVTSIPPNGLPVVWKSPVQGGYGGPAVAGGKVFVMDYARSKGDVKNDPGQRVSLQGTERVLCLSAATGDLLWKHEYECAYQISYPSGPRCTPTVHDGLVYALGAEGNLTAIAVDSGKVAWSKELKKDYQCEAPIWGFCGHPLVDGDRLICLVGGEGSLVVAFDRKTGAELWKGLTARESGYCPPSIIEHGGQRQLIVWTPVAIVSLDPQTGKTYWKQSLEPQYNMSIMMPRLEGNLLFAGGIGEVAAAFELDPTRPAAKVAWRATGKTGIFPANSTPVIHQGIIYGSDCKTGEFRAVRLATGERLWNTFAPTTGARRGGHGTAFVVRQGDQYWLFGEKGDLILAKLSPEQYTEVGRFHAVDATNECFGREVVWSHPAFSDRSAFIRNDKELVRVNLAQ